MTYNSMRQALIAARSEGIELPEFKLGPAADRSLHYTDCGAQGLSVFPVEDVVDATWWKNECLTCFDQAPKPLAEALEMVRTATHYGNEVDTIAELLSQAKLFVADQSRGNECYDTLYEWRSFCDDYRELADHDGLSVLQRKDMLALKDDSLPLAHFGHRVAAATTRAARDLIATKPLREFLVRPHGSRPRPALYATRLRRQLSVPGRGQHAHLYDVTLPVEATRLAHLDDHVLVEWDLRLHRYTDARGLALPDDYTQLELETALQVYVNADDTLTLQNALDAVRTAQAL